MIIHMVNLHREAYILRTVFYFVLLDHQTKCHTSIGYIFVISVRMEKNYLVFLKLNAMLTHSPMQLNLT